ncbi:CP2G1 protein, partial [Origma solitaria]|nr:CP2G1 protein [Origma solitaria]
MVDRLQMPFTEATIYEIQRCTDLIPMNIPRRVTRDTNFRGFHLPKGMDVYPLLSTVLNDPTSFKNPQNFDPGNFLDERGQFQRNEAFMPFSAGKRLCLGEGLARMELFLFLTTILQNLQPQPLGPPEEVHTTPLESGFANIPPPYKLRMLPR